MIVQQIWFGKMTRTASYCTDQVQNWVKSRCLEYDIFYGQDQGGTEQNMIASDQLRLDMARVRPDMLYVDCDIMLKHTFEVSKDTVQMAFFKKYPLEALFYTHDCQFFQSVPEIKSHIGSLRKAIKTKWIENKNQVDKFEENDYVHYMESAHKLNYY